MGSARGGSTAPAAFAAFNSQRASRKSVLLKTGSVVGKMGAGSPASGGESVAAAHAVVQILHQRRTRLRSEPERLTADDVVSGVATRHLVNAPKPPSTPLTSVSGRRLVDVGHAAPQLAAALQCPGCAQVGQLVCSSDHEQRRGLGGSLCWFCLRCNEVTIVTTLARELAKGAHAPAAL